jgi:hypothetical protein
MTKTREIKFRAWDEQEKRMASVISLSPGCWDNRGRVYSVLLQKTGEYEGPGPVAGTELYRSVQYKRFIIPAHLMQYTGLKDKNGKEIYEGDIVRIPGGYQGDYHEREKISVVKWEDEDTAEIGFYLNLPECVHWKHLEVIGNIYENPELLK